MAAFIRDGSVTARSSFPDWREHGDVDGGERVGYGVRGGSGATPVRGAPEDRRLSGYGSGYVYDVFPDGQRFLIDQIADEQAAPSPSRVITNWTATLR